MRHGTQALTASPEVGNGEIIKPHVGDTRTEADLAALVRDTLNTALRVAALGGSEASTYRGSETPARRH